MSRTITKKESSNWESLVQEQGLLDQGQAAYYLNTTVNTLIRWKGAGRIKAYVVGIKRGRVYYKKKELATFLVEVQPQK